MRTSRIAVMGTRGFPGVQGGIETHCGELYPRIVARGHAVRVYARRAYVGKGVRSCRGVEVFPLPTLGAKHIEAIAHTLFSCLHVHRFRSQFDLIHIHGIGPGLLTPLVRMTGRPVVVTNHGQDYRRDKWGPVARLALRIGEASSMRFASVMIAVSRQIRDELETKYRRPVIYIPNGVAEVRRVPPGEMIGRHRLRPGKYFLAAGRLVPEKGFHELMEAFGRVAGDYQLVLAGGADHEDDYSRSLLAQAMRDRRVTMTGRVETDVLAELYSNAAAVVLPSHHEGLPLVLLEAISYGLPVVLSDIPAHREIMTDERSFFRCGDVAALAASLNAFIIGGDLPAAGVVRDEYNWDRIADRTLEVYKQLVTRPPDAPRRGN